MFYSLGPRDQPNWERLPRTPEWKGYFTITLNKQKAEETRCCGELQSAIVNTTADKADGCFKQSFALENNTWDMSPRPRGMNSLQPETTSRSQISIYTPYPLTLKKPTSKIQDLPWKGGCWKYCHKDLKIPRWETLLVVLLLPQRSDAQQPKGGGDAWSGSHSDSVLALFSFSHTAREQFGVLLADWRSARLRWKAGWTQPAWGTSPLC